MGDKAPTQTPTSTRTDDEGRTRQLNFAWGAVAVLISLMVMWLIAQGLA